MSYEAWGDPPDPEPNPCALCDNELGSSSDCKMCAEFNRANKAESRLSSLITTLAHRVRILKTRKVYEAGEKGNGVSVELLQAITLISGIPGLLLPHEVDRRLLAEAEKALLVFDNARYMYADVPGCNCLHDDKPHPAIHAETCPYRIRYSEAWGLARPAMNPGIGTVPAGGEGGQG